MNKEESFDRAGFMAYMEANFNGFENPFLRELVNNIIDYAHKHEHVSKDQFCYFIADMLPEVEFGEVAMFTDAACLTQWGQVEAVKAMERMQK